MFNIINQNQEENIEECVTDLRRIKKNCDYCKTRGDGTSTHEKAYNNIIQKLTIAPTSSFYDPEKELPIESDASEYE